MRLHALDAWVRSPAALTDLPRLKETLYRAADAGGATVLGERFCVFPNGAVTGARPAGRTVRDGDLRRGAARGEGAPSRADGSSRRPDANLDVSDGNIVHRLRVRAWKRMRSLTGGRQP